MSYCVNCGVELEKSIKKCPLCNTPVLNPNDAATMVSPQSPYPETRGTVERASKSDLIILFSILWGSIAVCCGLLNYFVYNGTRWSLFIVGFCAIMWMLMTPPLIIKNLRKRVFALLVGITVCVYIALIGSFLNSYRWCIELGIPITLLVLILVEIFLTIGKFSRSVLVLSSVIFGEIAILCIGIELLIERYYGMERALRWSAIVLTICVIMIITIITMLSRRRVRTQLHRRFHL